MNVMVDLETLGNRAGCVILSIGAVVFDKDNGVGEDFYTVINTQTCIDVGLHKDESTVAWWKAQSATAQRVVLQAESSRVSLQDALSAFDAWLRAVAADRGENLSNVKVWGNGADFDNAILQSAHAAIGSKLPWDFWNNRCHRTLKNLYPEVTAQKFQGVKHNALDDARMQAVHAIDIMCHMEELRNPPSWWTRLCRRWLLV